MLDGLNKEVISFLFKAELPSGDTEVTVANPRQQARQETYEQKDEIQNLDERSAENRAIADSQHQQQQQTVETIVREEPKIGRNDRVIIKNVMNGESKEVKFKKEVGYW